MNTILFTVIDNSHVYNLYLNGQVEGFSPNALVINWAADFVGQLIAQINDDSLVMPKVDQGSLSVLMSNASGSVGLSHGTPP